MDHSSSLRWSSFRRGALAALYYISASVALTLFIKILFQKYPVTSPVLVLFSQTVITIFILSMLSLLRTPATLNPMLLTHGQHAAHVRLFASYIGMLIFNLFALHKTSLLMYHTLRRTSIAAVLLLQIVLVGKPPTRATSVAAVLIICGAFSAAATNLRFEAATYALTACANFASAYYLIRLKNVRETLELTNLQLLYLNNLYAFPVLLGLLQLLPPDGEVWALFFIPKLFLGSSSFAIILNHAVYVNTTVNDAVAHTASAQVKDFFLLAVGILAVDDKSSRSRGMVQGALTGFAGSLVYAFGKLMTSSTGQLGKVESTRVQMPALRQCMTHIETEKDFLQHFNEGKVKSLPSNRH